MGGHQINQAGEVVNIQHNTNVVTPIRTQLLHGVNKSGATFNDCYAVTHKPGASLYEPINGDPYVVVFSSPTEAVAHEFKPDNQASGTDKLRARIIAGRFFEGVTQ
jgi:hypothetical protein